MALNLNVGILGHVDSGKTTLAKTLSEIASTAAFDKDPQSQSRGITLDLGFSSFSISTPSHLCNKVMVDKFQYTLVDCPGHASLIKTVIGGSHIIDMILLVIDITKGIQTQTAECLVIGEITQKPIIVVLNKIDLITPDKQDNVIEKVTKKVRASLKGTVFKDSPIVAVSVNPNGEHQGLTSLINQISESSFIPDRQSTGPFLFAVDHCFGIKGQGTILTGTVLNGRVAINDVIEIPVMALERKVKSIQVFRKPVKCISQGDRAANDFNFDEDYEFINNLNPVFDENHQTAKYFALIEFDKPVLATDNSLVIASKLDVDASSNTCRIGFWDASSNTCRIGFWGNLLQYSKDKDYCTSFLPKLKVYKVKTKIGSIERIVDDNTAIVKNMFKKETRLDSFLGLKVTTSFGDIGRIDSSFGKSGKIKVCFENSFNGKVRDIVEKKKNDSDNRNNKVEVTLSFKKYVFDINKRIYQ
ncbi:Elongation factor Tu GTP binding domain [Popillia japonica]|uniref:Elongation factor Tu GTP binding domain n=1 Tax=Popillia japonica TaxID=7064 RepID=A0AAW1KFB0_POPJA